MLLRRLTSSLLLLALVSLPLAGQPVPAADGHESRAAHAFEAAHKQGPLALREFLVDMPKGADLHVHLAGAVYAESFLRAAAEDGLCVDTIALKFDKPSGKACGKDQITAADLLAHTLNNNQQLYDKLIDAFSMRSFVPYAEWSGHDQFFSTFDRFSGTDKKHTGEWVDEIVTRAAAQNEQYIEIMETPPFGHAASLGCKIGWDANLATLRQKLLDAGLDEEVAAAKEHIEEAVELRRKIERCSLNPQEAGMDENPACHVQVRFLYQILRNNPNEQVFAQTLLGFETISRLPQYFVGINFVEPEDGPTGMRNYTEQMQMLDYLHSVYPGVHISLHAGELAPGLVPPAGLRFHIRQAVDLGHAERIGHGVDIMYEDNPSKLLKELADRHVMIEVNLTSNDGILGIKGADHPLPMYRKAGVPVALSTDDEGVSRIDLTHEYVRAALDFNLNYSDLKQMARTGMEHNFLPGKSLWAALDKFTTPVTECRNQPLGGDKPSGPCKTFLDGNEKAAAQWEQERRFRAFEAKW